MDRHTHGNNIDRRHSHPDANETARVRVPTVQEALPFTPFASIIPFDPAMILAPTCGSLRPQSIKIADKNTIRVLDKLNAGASRAEKASKECQTTLHNMRRLLQNTHAPPFKIRKPLQGAHANQQPTPHQGAHANQQANTIEYPKLSKFAQMLLDLNPIEGYQLQADASQSTPVAAKTPKAAKRPSIAQPDHPAQPQTPNKQQGHMANDVPSSQWRHLTPVVVQDSGPRTGIKAHATVHVDQKAKGESAVGDLMSLLQDIFVADDAMSTGEDLNNEILATFRYQDSEEGTLYLLTHTYQVRLEAAVQKVINAGRIQSIPVDYLKRVQAICSTVVKNAARSPSQLQDHLSEGELEDWQLELVAAENALLCIRIVFKIMATSGTNRELQSEDLLRAMLQTFQHVAEAGIVAIVELHGDKKKGGDTSLRFATASEHKDQLILMLRGFDKVVRSLDALLIKVNLDDSAISSILYTCKLLIFAENASSEKDTVFGVQQYERCRRRAMDVMCRVFDKYPAQRQYIFDEILMSLEKLPANKQSARQYRVAENRSIQLVSALIMQLIQTSATKSSNKTRASQLDDDDSASEEHDDEEDISAENTPVKKQTIGHLRSLIAPLFSAATSNASYVVAVLMKRALGTLKSSEEPYRKLFDIFTQDFMSVIDLPEWPAAELLLTLQLNNMFRIIEDRKSSVSHRQFALEFLGHVGAGMSKLQSAAQTSARSSSESEVSRKLTDLLRQAVDDGVAKEDLYHLEGPYRVVLEYLHGQQHDGTQIGTASDYFMMQWARNLCPAHEAAEPNGNDEEKKLDQPQLQVQGMLTDAHWFETQAVTRSITASEARMAATVIALSSRFCSAFAQIFHTLLRNTASEQPTIKGRSLRSVVQLVEADPTVLDRNSYILPGILKCLRDPSVMVRDAALSLLGRCMELRPTLDGKLYEHIIQRLEDPSTTVQKRSIKELKDIYLRNEDTPMLPAIATALIMRMKDVEDAIINLSKHTIEEIWFQPLYTGTRNDTSNLDVKCRAQAALMIRATDANDDMSEALVSLLQDLHKDGKSGADNIRVSKLLIDELYDGIIDSAHFSNEFSQAQLLLALAVFARAGPTLFKPAQLELLEPYTKNLASNDDLVIFRLALTTLRHTMPFVRNLKKNFLTNLQQSLLGTLGKLPASEFSEVAVCLWAIDGELKNTEHLLRIVVTALRNLQNVAGQPFSEASTSRLLRFTSLLGQFGKACDFEPFAAEVKKTVPNTKSKTVGGMIIECVTVFASDKAPSLLRAAAVETICAVCQRWPKQFLTPEVGRLFEKILKGRVPELEKIFLESLLEFFDGQEIFTSSDGDGEATGRERLAKTYAATDQDGAAASLCQRFLGHILSLATSSVDSTALTATKLVASIVRQGLPHPKETGPSLIALETSPNHAIAQLACAEHRTMHEKHETIIEREYVRAMEQALHYQVEVIGNARGSIGSPPVAKLSYFWSVLKAGKTKVRQKYLTTVSQRLSFELATLVTKEEPPQHLIFVRFMVENLALFEYDKFEDLRLLVEGLSKVFSSAGSPLSQSIETEVFNMSVEAVTSSQADEHSSNKPADLGSADSKRLKTFAMAAQILMLIGEARAFLIRYWGIRKLLQKEKTTAKDATKSLARVSNAVTLAEAFVKRIEQLAERCLDRESHMQICQTFVEAYNVDSDVKGGSEDEGEDEEGDVTGLKSPGALGTPSRKRKSASVGAEGPRKRGRPRKTPNSYDEGDDDSDGEWQ